MIKAKTARRIANNINIKDFVNHALMHISYNIGKVANQGGRSFTLPLNEYTDSCSLQEYGEFLILLGNELQANGYKIVYDYTNRKFAITW